MIRRIPAPSGVPILHDQGYETVVRREPSQERRKPQSVVVQHLTASSGAGIRTPDTRIMIPRQSFCTIVHLRLISYVFKGLQNIRLSAIVQVLRCYQTYWLQNGYK